MCIYPHSPPCPPSKTNACSSASVRTTFAFSRATAAPRCSCSIRVARADGSPKASDGTGCMARLARPSSDGDTPSAHRAFASKRSAWKCEMNTRRSRGAARSALKASTAKRSASALVTVSQEKLSVMTMPVGTPPSSVRYCAVAIASKSTRPSGSRAEGAFRLPHERARNAHVGAGARRGRQRLSRRQSFTAATERSRVHTGKPSEPGPPPGTTYKISTREKSEAPPCWRSDPIELFVASCGAAGHAAVAHAAAAASIFF
mmetsp:Transcript_43444/g.92467  ORF Transcript_43444/g.92467 Transcript_43444/m.92467 type:complete len:260 (-) Transcript_43444:5-784(-)